MQSGCQHEFAGGCGALHAPWHGTISRGGTSFGSVRDFSCDTGYILRGSESRTCQSNGKWTGSFTRCTGKKLAKAVVDHGSGKLHCALRCSRRLADVFLKMKTLDCHIVFSFSFHKLCLIYKKRVLI